MAEGESASVHALGEQCRRMGIGHVDVTAAAPENRTVLDDGKLDYVRVLSLANVALDAVHLAQPEATARLQALGYSEVRYIHDEATDTTAVVASNGKEVVASIRGYDSPKDSATAHALGMEPSALGGEVSTGFIKTLYSSSPPVINQLHQAIEEVSEASGGGLPVHVASYSMGGAVSSVMVAEMLAQPERFPQAAHLRTNLTFGTLAPGDSAFSEAFALASTMQGIESVTIVNENDLTPLLPPLNSHVGTRVILQKDGSTTVGATSWDNFARLSGTGHTEAHYQSVMLDRIRMEALMQVAGSQPELYATGAITVAENTCVLAGATPSAPEATEHYTR